MLFNSIEFLIFLPIVFILYWFVFKSLRWQNFFVIVASYLFYGWWDWRFLILIALTTFCSFISGVILEKTENRPTFRKWISISNIIFNLLILGIFKYYNFFGENLSALLKLFNIQTDWVTIDILLPVGISFYTFQALSYTIDVYCHKIKPTHDIVAFFAFISFFPQLVAGPIERATNLLPQFLNNRTFNYEKAVNGVRQILWGMFKKIVIADNCATVVNITFTEYQSLDGMSLLLGAICFSFQIYGDFSGYSDIAVGTARLFGIDLMRNFNCPYFSRNIAEFWKRWHISLTSWFRDYLYIPLGGSRCKQWKVIRNTMIIFLVSGLWHGANWTFICWGVFHALLFMPLIMAKKNKKYKEIVAKGKQFPTVVEFMQMFATFVLVTIGWIIFRAETIQQAWMYMTHMVTQLHFCMPLYGKTTFIYILLLLLIEWIQRDKEHGFQITYKGFFKFSILRYGVYLFVSYKLLMLLLFQPQTEFIYFQF